MRKLPHFFVCVLYYITSIAHAAEIEARHVVLITIDGFPARMFWDQKTSIPTLRALAREGVAAERLICSNPTVTWPNHTTLLTGVPPARHSVLYNGRLVRGAAGVPVRIEPKSDKADLVAVPTLYDVLRQAGLPTAAINWPCTRNAAIDENFPDVPDNLLHTTPELRRQLVSEGVLPDETDASFDKMTGPGRDEVWLAAACRSIRQRKPALLSLHLLNTDGIHHKYGPESSASHTALALADSYVGRLMRALDEAGIRKDTAVFVVADHGFATATNVLQPNVLLRQGGWLQVGASNKLARAKAQVVPEGGTGMVYLTDPATRESDRKQIAALFRARPEIAEVIEPERFAALGFPDPSRNPQMADLVLVPKRGYAIGGNISGDDFAVAVSGTINQGYHGFMSDDSRMEALFVASGRGIRKAGKVGTVDNRDIAPTIAYLLGQSLPNAEGKVLREILE